MRKSLPSNARDEAAAKRSALEAMQAGSLSANTLKPLWPAPYNEATYEARKRWVFEIAWTWHEQERVAMRFPPLEYLEFFIWHWHHTRAAGLPLVLHKSRRIILSWCARALELHDMGLSPGSQMLADSTFTKSSEHIWRYYFMYERIREQNPGWKLIEGTPYGSLPAKQLEKFVLPNGAIFDSINSDSGSIQGSGVSGVTLEELSGYRYMESMWSQANFVTQSEKKSGHVVALANTAYKKAWNDMIEEDEADTRAPDPGEKASPLHCKVYNNKRGIRILQIHYLADPAKRDPAWIERESKKHSRSEWYREMELGTEVASGEVVYPEFQPDWHGHKAVAAALAKRRNQDISPQSLFIGGTDAGNTMHPASVLVEITPRGQLIAIAEVPPPMGVKGMAIIQFAPLMLKTYQKAIPTRYTEIEYPCDMTCNHRMGVESAAMVARKVSGIDFKPMTNNPEARHGAVVWALTDTLPGDEEDDPIPRFLIDREKCPYLFAALCYGYCYEVARESEQMTPRPCKNRYADIADALQYALMRCQKIVKNYEAMAFGSGANITIWQTLNNPQGLQAQSPPQCRQIRDYRRRQMR